MAAMTLARPAAHLWAAYCDQLVRRPLLSRCLTGVAGAVVSDAAAQLGHRAVVQSQRGSGDGAGAAAAAAAAASRDPRRAAAEGEWRYEWSRSARLALYTFFIGTPLAYRWFHFLDKAVMAHAPTSPLAVACKVAADQLLMAPAGLALFLGCIKAMEGRPREAPAFVREKYLPLLQANVAVWVPVHAVNFALVPPAQRILYINVVAVMWGVFISHRVMGGGGGDDDGGGDDGDGGRRRRRRRRGVAPEPLDEALLEEAAAAAAPH